ncbi:MAG: hypothetical protein LKF31_01545 [Muribaculaceae bacterium]|nr:hypothetical protein [Muribaculaceae bacterium]
MSCLLVPFGSYATETTLVDFESAVTLTTNYGSTASIVANPLKAGLDTTDNCLQVGRTSSNWYEMTDIPVSFTIPAGETRDIHILVKYAAQPDVAIRVNTSNPDIRPIARYTDFGNWQDLVFVITNTDATDLAVTQLRYEADMGFENVPSGQILSSTTFGYIDEIKLEVPEMITTNSILNFEDKADTESKVAITTQSDTYTLDNFCDNPENGTINKSNKCLLFESPVLLTNTGNWWHGPKIAFKKPIKLDTDRKYLHIMMKKDAVDGGTVWVADDNTNYISVVFAGTDWVDYVSSPITATTINVLNFKMNSGANVKCYIDNIWVDNDPNPRTVDSGVKGISTNGLKVFGTNGGIEVISDRNVNIPVFDVLGRLVKNISVRNGDNFVNIQSGLYILNGSKVVVK